MARPSPLARTEARWRAPCEPEGTLPVPDSLPSCGTRRSGANAASRWLQRRGWVRLDRLAKLWNVDPRWLRKQAQRGRIRYLRVGQFAFFTTEEEMAHCWHFLAESGTFSSWVAAGRPWP